jgi:hypothetical protein
VRLKFNLDLTVNCSFKQYIKKNSKNNHFLQNYHYLSDLRLKMSYFFSLLQSSSFYFEVLAKLFVTGLAQPTELAKLFEILAQLFILQNFIEKKLRDRFKYSNNYC